MFDKVVIVGAGLVGGSFALALRRAGIVGRLVGVDRDSEALADALRLGLVDVIAHEHGPACENADLVLLAAPVAQTAAVLSAVLPFIRDSTILTDVGSTKGDVVDAARHVLGTRIGQFVPGHPIAGRETHGPCAASVDLFDGKRVILTPLSENAQATVARVRAAWQHCGARVTTMDVAQHDRILASVSHLPHVLAYALVAQIVDGPDSDLKLELAGAGFRDFTRIAASSPEMWRDIVLANRDVLLDELDRYREVLDALRAMIEASDGAGIEAVFERASRTRQAWQAWQASS